MEFPGHLLLMCASELTTIAHQATNSISWNMTFSCSVTQLERSTHKMKSSIILHCNESVILELKKVHKFTTSKMSFEGSESNLCLYEITPFIHELCKVKIKYEFPYTHTKYISRQPSDLLWWRFLDNSRR